MEAEFLEGRGGQTGGVSLVADDDDGQVVMGDGQAGVAGWVQAPFEDVALDDDGAGDFALHVPVGLWADVDDDRAAAR